MHLFLNGMLLDHTLPDLRSGVHALHRWLRPAQAASWRRVILAGTRYPALCRHYRAEVRGGIVTVGAAAVARLSAYEGPRYRFVRVVVATPRGKTAAWIWGRHRKPWSRAGRRRRLERGHAERNVIAWESRDQRMRYSIFGLHGRAADALVEGMNR